MSRGRSPSIIHIVWQDHTPYSIIHIAMSSKLTRTYISEGQDCILCPCVERVFPKQADFPGANPVCELTVHSSQVFTLPETPKSRTSLSDTPGRGWVTSPDLMLSPLLLLASTRCSLGFIETSVYICLYTHVFCTLCTNMYYIHYENIPLRYVQTYCVHGVQTYSVGCVQIYFVSCVHQ